MAIFTTYAQFRAGFNPFTPVGADGFKSWSGGDVVTPVLEIPTTIIELPFLIIVNNTINDAVAGVDEWDWYLSQRTDNSARQYFTVDRADELPNTRSGRIAVNVSALATGLGYGNIPMSTTEILALFTDVEVYARERATGFIHHASLLEALTGDA
jgi:hypothetical protein